MKITLETLANCFQSIIKLSNFDLGDPKTNFRFMGVIDTIETQAKKYNKLRRDILEKYGNNDGSDYYAILPEKQDVCNKELNDLGAVEIDLDWDIIDRPIKSLKGFTAIDMKCLNGTFINIKGD